MKIAKYVFAGAGILAAQKYWQTKAAESKSFKNQVVVITGGRGLAFAIAQQLANEGARLALLARDEAELQRAKKALTVQGVEVLTVSCDVREAKSAQQAIEQVIRYYNQLDVLINDAGIIQVAPIENLRTEDFEDAMATHFWGPYFTMQAAIPQLKKQGGGKIVNISSIGGEIAVPHLLPYSASKFALVGLSDGVRSELAKDHITVTTVCPGLIRTGSAFNAFFKGKNKQEFGWFSVSDSMPLISMSAERTAHQIIEACRLGQPKLTTTTLARFGVIMNTLFPGLTARILMLANLLLPKASDAPGADSNKTGWQSQSAVAPSPLTALSNEAATKFNELMGHKKIAEG